MRFYYVIIGKLLFRDQSRPVGEPFSLARRFIDEVFAYGDFHVAEREARQFFAVFLVVSVD